MPQVNLPANKFRQIDAISHPWALMGAELQLNKTTKWPSHDTTKPTHTVLWDGLHDCSCRHWKLYGFNWDIVFYTRWVSEEPVGAAFDIPAKLARDSY